MELFFVKISIIFARSSILDIQLGSEYASAISTIMKLKFRPAMVVDERRQ